MVGPATDEEKAESMTRLKVGIVALVSASAGLVTLSGGGSALQVAAAVAAGAVVGVVLLAYLFRIA